MYIALFSYVHNPTNFNYFILAFIGLIFSFFGDTFLVLKSKSTKGLDNMFFLGLICFLVTHVFYSLSFITLGSLNIFTFIVTILIFFSFIIFFKSIKNFNFKNMTIPCYIYIFAICFMFCNSISLTNCNLNNTGLILIISGAFLFMISDFILSFILFFDNYPKFMIPINLLTYYFGQVLIALSILYI